MFRSTFWEFISKLPSFHFKTVKIFPQADSFLHSRVDMWIISNQIWNLPSYKTTLLYPVGRSTVGSCRFKGRRFKNLVYSSRRSFRDLTMQGREVWVDGWRTASVPCGSPETPWLKGHTHFEAIRWNQNTAWNYALLAHFAFLSRGERCLSNVC